MNQNTVRNVTVRNVTISTTPTGNTTLHVTIQPPRPATPTRPAAFAATVPDLTHKGWSRLLADVLRPK
jgi:hypothetical protein